MTDKTPTPAPESAAKPAAAPASGRAVRIVLVLSLAANLLVVGVVAGGWIAGRGPMMALGGFDMTLGPFTDALEPNDREAVRERLRTRADLRPRDRRERDQLIATFLDAVRADPFDAAAVEAIFADQRNRATAGMSAGQDVLLERLKMMTPAQRAAFAGRLTQRLNPGHTGRP